MKVKELIEELQKQDPEIEILPARIGTASKTPIRLVYPGKITYKRAGRVAEYNISKDLQCDTEEYKREITDPTPLYCELFLLESNHEYYA